MAVNSHNEGIQTNRKYLNFQSLEVVSRYRDPQLQVTENLYDDFKLKKNPLVSMVCTKLLQRCEG